MTKAEADLAQLDNYLIIFNFKNMRESSIRGFDPEKLPGVEKMKGLSPEQKAGGKPTLETLNQAEQRMKTEKENKQWEEKIKEARAKAEGEAETELGEEDIEILEDKDLPN